MSPEHGREQCICKRINNVSNRNAEKEQYEKKIKHTSYRIKCVTKVAPLPAAFLRQTVAIRSSEQSEMIIKFYVAYNIAKEELPFTKFRKLF